MRIIASLATTAILLCTPVGFALAQSSTDSGAPATSAAPPPPAPPPAAEAPPASTPAPAPQSANPPAASTPSTTPAPATADNGPKDAPKTAKTKKKKLISSSQRREIDRSIDSGTVPSRYRNQVPKEYQQYIPFSKD